MLVKERPHNNNIYLVFFLVLFSNEAFALRFTKTLGNSPHPIRSARASVDRDDQDQQPQAQHASARFYDPTQIIKDSIKVSSTGDMDNPKTLFLANSRKGNGIKPKVTMGLKNISFVNPMAVSISPTSSQSEKRSGIYRMNNGLMLLHPQKLIEQSASKKATLEESTNQINYHVIRKASTIQQGTTPSSQFNASTNATNPGQFNSTNNNESSALRYVVTDFDRSRQDLAESMFLLQSKESDLEQRSNLKSSTEQSNQQNIGIDRSNLESVKVDPSNLQSVEIDRSNPLSVKTDRSNLESVKVDPSNLQSVEIDQSNPLSVKTDRSNLESVKVDPSDLQSFEIDRSNSQTIGIKQPNPQFVQENRSQINQKRRSTSDDPLYDEDQPENIRRALKHKRRHRHRIYHRPIRIHPIGPIQRWFDPIEPLVPLEHVPRIDGEEMPRYTHYASPIQEMPRFPIENIQLEQYPRFSPIEKIKPISQLGVSASKRGDTTMPDDTSDLSLDNEDDVTGIETFTTPTEIPTIANLTPITDIPTIKSIPNKQVSKT